MRNRNRNSLRLFGIIYSFLIYISEIFKKVSETSFLAISLSFIKNWGFIALGNSIKEIIEVLEKVAKKVIEWRRLNAITYDTSKTQAVLFSRSY